MFSRSKDDKIPPLNDITVWKYIAKKPGGAHSAGDYVGVYQYQSYKALFKRDVVIKRNIVEIFTAGMLRDLVPEKDKPFFPQIQLAEIETKSNEIYESESNNPIYLGVLIFDDCLEVCKDALLAHAAFPHLYGDSNKPNYIINKEGKRELPDVIVNIPKKHPTIVEACPISQKVIAKGRYLQFGRRLAIMSFVENKDIHLSNIAAQGREDQPYVIVKGKDHLGVISDYKVYEGCVNTVTYDYGWALASERILHKSLSDKMTNYGNDPISPIMNYLYGTFDYEKFYADEVRYGQEYIAQLKQIYSITDEALKKNIEKNVNKLNLFKKEHLFEFANYIGAYFTNDSSQYSKQHILLNINAFLQRQFIKRKESIPQFIEAIEKPHFSTKIRDAYQYVYHADHRKRSKIAAFLGANASGEKLSFYKKVRLPLKLSKNIFKKITELFPAMIQASAEWGLISIEYYDDKKEKPYSRLKKTAIFSLKILLIGILFIGKLTFFIGSRITSPVRAANESQHYFETLLDNQKNPLLAQSAGYLAFCFSMTFSAFLHMILFIYMAPPIMTLMGVTTTSAFFGAALTWLSNLPVLSELAYFAANSIGLIAEWIGLKVVVMNIAKVAVSMAFITTLCFSLKALFLKVTLKIDRVIKESVSPVEQEPEEDKISIPSSDRFYIQELELKISHHSMACDEKNQANELKEPPSEKPYCIIDDSLQSTNKCATQRFGGM